MTDRTRVEALLAATSNRWMELVDKGMSPKEEAYWMGKVAGIRACLSFMDPSLKPIPEPESVDW